MLLTDCCWYSNVHIHSRWPFTPRWHLFDTMLIFRWPVRPALTDHLKPIAVGHLIPRFFMTTWFGIRDWSFTVTWPIHDDIHSYKTIIDLKFIHCWKSTDIWHWLFIRWLDTIPWSQAIPSTFDAFIDIVTPDSPTTIPGDRYPATHFGDRSCVDRSPLHTDRSSPGPVSALGLRHLTVSTGCTGLTAPLGLVPLTRSAFSSFLTHLTCTPHCTCHGPHLNGSPPARFCTWITPPLGAHHTSPATPARSRWWFHFGWSWTGLLSSTFIPTEFPHTFRHSRSFPTIPRWHWVHFLVYTTFGPRLRIPTTISFCYWYCR